MKISVICICVFLLCTLYWAFGLSLILTSAEDPVSTTSETASVTASENNVSAVSDSELHQQSTENYVELKVSADIDSSFEDPTNGENEEVQQQDFAFIETVSQNTGVAHEVAGANLGVVHTLVDSATLELQEKAEELSAATATTTATSHHNETPNLSETLTKENVIVEIKLDQVSEEIISSNNTQQTEQPGTKVPTVEPKSNNLTEEGGNAREEIPSFSEWAQKQLEKDEKKKEQANSSAQSQNTNGKLSSNIKKRWKNYASPDCGAKIIATNPEAISAGSVLSASRDEYKLNACTSRIWFIVELCEAIQAKKIELANFELFSSSPKDFTISVSDRYPSRDWSSVGQFTAKDERDVQSFDLYPHLFGKFIKFEMHSHHGSEHYCPISLFRVYGTSEFEVLETENQVHDSLTDDDEDEEPVDVDNGETPKNLFSSATDAVISIVKKAAEVLGNKGNASTDSKDQQNATIIKTTPLISTCTTPSHIIVCDNCSDLLFGGVFHLLSCNSKMIMELLNNKVVKYAIYRSDICSNYGLEFHDKSVLSTRQNSCKSYINAMFPQKLIAALCNMVAINECKVVRNISSNATTMAPLSQNTGDKIVTTKIMDLINNLESDSVLNTMEVSVVDPITEQRIVSPTDSNVSETTFSIQIKPTKTLSADDDLNYTDTFASAETTDSEQVAHSSVGAEDEENVTTTSNEDKQVHLQVEQIETNSDADVETTTESSDGLYDPLDSLVSELNGDAVPSSTVSPPVMPQGQKESVFLRLSNRIKALERNMSLSSQYLEELSRRYKKQVEEMQRLLDKTINTLNEENKKKEERSRQLEEQIIALRESIEDLIDEKNSWMTTTYWVFISGIVILGTLLFCRRSNEFKHSRSEEAIKSSAVQRRKSVDVITHKTPLNKKRRPSEEASMISGTYTDLMIEEVDSNSSRLKEKKRRKKKQPSPRSTSITTLNEEMTNNEDLSVEIDQDFTPAKTSTQIWKRQDSAPCNLLSDWVSDSIKHDQVPFVLDESEHTSLEPLSYIPVLNKLANGKLNGNFVGSMPYTLTATDSRSKRISQKQKNGKNKVGHKKSASFDESKRQSTPSPISADSASMIFDESSRCFIDVPKKEKKGTFKRFFRNFTFK